MSTRACEQLKVLWSIVVRYLILVMDEFVWCERASEMLCEHDAMLKAFTVPVRHRMLPTNKNPDVPTLDTNAAAFPSVAVLASQVALQKLRAALVITEMALVALHSRWRSLNVSLAGVAFRCDEQQSNSTRHNANSIRPFIKIRP